MNIKIKKKVKNKNKAMNAPLLLNNIKGKNMPENLKNKDIDKFVQPKCEKLNKIVKKNDKTKEEAFKKSHLSEKLIKKFSKNSG